MACSCDCMPCFLSMSVNVMVMSFAYVVNLTSAWGVGMSDIYMLNNVCDRRLLVVNQL